MTAHPARALLAALSLAGCTIERPAATADALAADADELAAEAENEVDAQIEDMGPVELWSSDDAEVGNETSEPV